MRASVLTVLVLASVSVGAPQRPPILSPPPQPGPAPRSNVRPTEVKVTIDGCLRGRQLLPLRFSKGAHEQGLNASEFLLEGSRELLQQLTRDHNGHQERITGIAILPPGGETVDTRTKEIGSARVTGAVRQSGTSRTPEAAALADSPRPVRVRVLSATHVDESCVSSS
jgi:hypothetical protein